MVFEDPYSKAGVARGLHARVPRDRSGQLAWSSGRPSQKGLATCPKCRSIGTVSTGARLSPISAPKSLSIALVSSRLGSLV